MKIDLVHPWPIFWHMAGGWVSALKKLGVLGRVFPLKEESSEKFFSNLPGQDADLVIFLCADQHMSYLHDTAQKRAALQNIPVPTICYANESIIDTVFSKINIPRAKQAKGVYDFYLCADEVDTEFFLGENSVVAWCPQFADGNAFKPNRPLHKRESGAFFFGQTSTFGIDDAIYADRRAIIDKVRHIQNIHIIDRYIKTKKSPRKLVKIFNSYTQALCLPTNVGTYTNRVYEAAACGNLILHYHMKNRPKHAALFKEGVDYVRFDKDDPDELIEKVKYYGLHYDEMARIALNGHEIFTQFHSIEQRIKQIVQFVKLAKEPGEHEFPLTVENNSFD